MYTMYCLSGGLTLILVIVWWFEKLQRCTDIQYGEILSQESKRMVSDSNPRKIGSFVELTASEMLGHQRVLQEQRDEVFER